MKKYVVLIAVFVIALSSLGFGQVHQSTEVVQLFLENSSRTNGYGLTWGATSLAQTGLINLNCLDSLNLFVSAPDSFSVKVTAKLYVIDKEADTTTTNYASTGTLDSIRNISGAITSVSDYVIGAATTQLWTNLKAEANGQPKTAKFVFTFNTSTNHNISQLVSASEYFKVYARLFYKDAKGQKINLRNAVGLN